MSIKVKFLNVEELIILAAGSKYTLERAKKLNREHNPILLENMLNEKIPLVSMIKER